MKTINPKEIINAKVKEALSEDELRKANKIGVYKLAEAMRRIYNGLCRPCQVRVVRNSRTKLEEYCDKCRPRAEQITQELIDGVTERNPHL